MAQYKITYDEEGIEWATITYDYNVGAIVGNLAKKGITNINVMLFSQEECFELIEEEFEED